MTFPCFLFLLAFLSLAPSAFAGKKLRIVNIAYDQHFHPNESPTFTIIIQNSETTSEFAEVDVTLTNTETEAESTLTPVLTGTASPGGTVTLVGTYNVAAGNYTVSFPVFDGDGVKVDQTVGKYPLHIGDETESLRVFPEAIHLGNIPPGRYMHPVPVEVHWTFFRFNRLRRDQPFVIRIYTDNSTRFQGIPGSLIRASAAGLVSLDGKYVIPIKIWNLNYGPDIQETGWDSALAGPPPVEDDDSWLGPPLLEGSRHFGGASWIRIKDRAELAASPFGWTRGEGIIGQDPHDTRYANEKNVTGDISLRSPFSFYLATETGAASVEGPYAATLVVELWTP